MKNGLHYDMRCFDFYGVKIRVESASADLMEQVQRDFVYFLCQGNQDGAIAIKIHEKKPLYESMPAVKAAFFTPRNVCYNKDTKTYIDYFGKGLAIFDRIDKSCHIYGTDKDLVHEIVYLFILSIVGQYLDSRGIHRVHALGMSYKNKGMLLLLPSGGGKSTMALKLLKNSDFKLLGEDTPLIDRNLKILPFPLRLGVRPETDTGIPSRYLRTVSRMEFDPKTLIDIEYFGDRLGSATFPELIMVGERNLGNISEITPLSTLPAFKALVKYMVVGLGIYQGLEFLLERGVLDLLNKGGVVASRLISSLKLISHTGKYRFVMGRDTERNYETLIRFIHQKFG